MPLAVCLSVEVVKRSENEYELTLQATDLAATLAEWLDEQADNLPLTLYFTRAAQPVLTLTTHEELSMFAHTARVIGEQLIASPALPPVYLDANGQARVSGTDMLVQTLSRAWQAGVTDVILLKEYPELDSAKLDAVWAWLRRT